MVVDPLKQKCCTEIYNEIVAAVVYTAAQKTHQFYGTRRQMAPRRLNMPPAPSTVNLIDLRALVERDLSKQNVSHCTRTALSASSSTKTRFRI